MTKHKGTLFYRDLQNKKLQYESELATSLLKNKDLTLGEGVNTDNIFNDNFVEVSRLEQPSSTVSPDNKTESKETKSEAIEDYEGCYGCFFHKKKGGRTK